MFEKFRQGKEAESVRGFIERWTYRAANSSDVTVEIIERFGKKSLGTEVFERNKELIIESVLGRVL